MMQNQAIQVKGLQKSFGVMRVAYIFAMRAYKKRL